MKTVSLPDRSWSSEWEVTMLLGPFADASVQLTLCGNSRATVVVWLSFINQAQYISADIFSNIKCKCPFSVMICSCKNCKLFLHPNCIWCSAGPKVSSKGMTTLINRYHTWPPSSEYSAIISHHWQEPKAELDSNDNQMINDANVPLIWRMSAFSLRQHWKQN